MCMKSRSRAIVKLNNNKKKKKTRTVVVICFLPLEFPISASWLQKLLGTVISDLGSKCNSPKDTKYPTYGAPVSNQTAMMLFNSQSKVLSWVIIIIIKQNFQLWSACNFVYNELCCSNFWYYKILPGNKMVFGCFTSVESFRVLMIVKIKHIYFCGRALNEELFYRNACLSGPDPRFLYKRSHKFS